MFGRSASHHRRTNWLSALTGRGFQICPSSFTVPIELWGLLPDGRGFHLRCRGVVVRLDVYDPQRSRWEVPIAPVTDRPEGAYADYAIRPLAVPGRLDGRPEGARLVFADAEHPDERHVFDGRARLGWRGHEAALLTPAGAEVILRRLLGTGTARAA